RPVRGGGRAMEYHAGDGVGGVGEHLTGDDVQAGHVHHRRHERDVTAADVGGGVAAGDGRDEQLGQADRQGAQRRGDQGGAAAAAEADDAGDPAGGVFAAQEFGQRLAHGGDGLAAVGEAEDGGGAARVAGGDA